MRLHEATNVPKWNNSVFFLYVAYTQIMHRQRADKENYTSFFDDSAQIEREYTDEYRKGALSLNFFYAQFHLCQSRDKTDLVLIDEQNNMHTQNRFVFLGSFPQFFNFEL